MNRLRSILWLIASFAFLSGVGLSQDSTTKPVNADKKSFPEVKGFTYLTEESFACGGQTHKVAVYRFDRFHAILKTKNLLKEGRHPACEFVLLPPKGSSAKFTMGSPKEEKNRGKDEGPQHEVAIKKSFLMARTELTQVLWQEIMKTTLAEQEKKKDYGDMTGKGPLQPMYYINWEECLSLAKKTGLRLPSEAEWEYSCRAGTTTIFPSGDSKEDLTKVAWFSDGGFNPTTRPVATKKPNAFGLFDLSGNLDEWCQDVYQNSYIAAPTDGRAWEKAPAQSPNRITRGGNAFQSLIFCRSASRNDMPPSSRFQLLGTRYAAWVSP